MKISRSPAIRPSIRGWLVLMGLVALVNTGLAGPFGTTEFDVYQLTHASPLEARRMLRELAEDRADELQIVADAETGQLMVRGPHELRSLVSKLLDQIDRPTSPPTARRTDVIRTYPAGPERCVAIANELRQRFADDVRVATDTDGSGLIIVAAESIHEKVGRHLSETSASAAQRPAPSAPPGGDTFPAGKDIGSASATQPTISPEIWQLDSPGEPASVDAATLDPTETQIDSGEGFPSRQLQLSGIDDRDDTPRITMVNGVDVSVSDASSPPAAADVQTEYKFRIRPAREIRKALDSLIPDRMQAAGPDGYLIETAEERQLSIRFREADNRCSLTGPAGVVREFSKLLSQLDSLQPGPGRITRFIAVRNVEPDKLQQVIDIWRAPAAAMPAGRPSQFRPDSHQSNIRRAAYQTLGITGSSVSEQSVDPAELHSTTTVDSAKGPASAATASSTIEVQTLPDFRIVVLKGPATEVEQLTGIIDEVELMSAEGSPDLLVLPLHHVHGDSISGLVKDVGNDPLVGLHGRLSITPLPTADALLLMGSEEGVETARRLVAELDRPPVTTEARVFPLQHASAAEVKSALQRSYTNGSDLAVPVEIMVAPRSNSVIVEASTHELQELEPLIRKLDTE